LEIVLDGLWLSKMQIDNNKVTSDQYGKNPSLESGVVKRNRISFGGDWEAKVGEFSTWKWNWDFAEL